MNLEEIIKRSQKAHSTHDQWKTLWDECYEYSMPHRARFFSHTNGQKNTLNLYDSTAVTSIHEFASRLQAGLTPTFSRWSRLRPGRIIDPDNANEIQAKLDEIGEEVFAVLHRSNFDSQIHEAYMELGIGTGSLIADYDRDDVIRFTAVPLTQMAMDAGPWGTVDGRFRKRKIQVGLIDKEWPGANIPMELVDRMANRPLEEIEVNEATFRDWSKRVETHVYVVWLSSPKVEILRTTYSGAGACPHINFRWSVAAGEVYGRGPLLNAMPDVRVANVIVQLNLENAELAVSGLWQGEDDGVLNPNTITLLPGTIIPHARGSQGLRPLEVPSRFDLSQVILKDLQASIKRALYDEALGPPTGTPMSATEVQARMQDLYRRMGSAYGRLQRELVQPVIRRTIWLLKQTGRISLPSVDGDLVEIKSESPLASAQKDQDVQRMMEFAGALQGTFGQQLPLMMLMEPNKVAKWLADRKDIRADLFYTEEQQAQMLQQMQQMAQQMGPQAGGGGGMLG